MVSQVERDIVNAGRGPRVPLNSRQLLVLNSQRVVLSWVEIIELILADQIAAMRIGDALEPAVLDDPTFLRRFFFLIAVPAAQGLAVEKQFPAGLLLGGS